MFVDLMWPSSATGTLKQLGFVITWVGALNATGDVIMQEPLGHRTHSETREQNDFYFDFRVCRV